MRSVPSITRTPGAVVGNYIAPNCPDFVEFKGYVEAVLGPYVASDIFASDGDILRANADMAAEHPVYARGEHHTSMPPHPFSEAGTWG